MPIYGNIKMKLSSLDSGQVDEYNGIGLVEISRIFATHDTFFVDIEPFDRV